MWKDLVSHVDVNLMDPVLACIYCYACTCVIHKMHGVCLIPVFFHTGNRRIPPCADVMRLEGKLPTYVALLGLDNGLFIMSCNYLWLTN